MDIPIIIVCYNNYKYVQNTLEQILRINQDYYKNIQIINNNSTCLKTITFLNTVDVKVIYNPVNAGPWITPYYNSHIYNVLPDKFILTDPDLKFNEHLPTNFIEILEMLSDKYKTSKIGFHLDISDHELMFPETNTKGNFNSLDEFKNHYLENKLDDTYELYKYDIDTTFCLINKKYTHHEIRVAGNFTAKHLPWYIENEIYTVYENYMNNINPVYNNGYVISTTSNTITNYIENKYLKIYKNNELFLVENDETNLNFVFWKNIYSQWENDTFHVFDRYLSQDKVFIDIGAWIGTTAMYGERKSKHVYCIEADNISLHDLSLNLKTNCTNYTVIDKAIYNVDSKVKFGKNIHLGNSKMNDSTSHIYTDDTVSDDYYIKDTITIHNIIKTYKINIHEISLIKVDIEGGEEHILHDLFDLRIKYDVPLYISFHYSWWNDKNLDRFSFLTCDNKNQIITYPFTSILF